MSKAYATAKVAEFRVRVNTHAGKKTSRGNSCRGKKFRFSG
jgi:hypothetical protein